MDAREEDERIDISGKSSYKVIANAGFLSVVEFTPALQVVLGLVEDLDSHSRLRCRRSFTSGHSRNSASPFATRAARAARTSPCQAGEGTPSGDRHRSSQSSSITRSFAARLISLKGKVVPALTKQKLAGEWLRRKTAYP